MIAGGGDALSEFAFSGFSSLGALTKDVVRPFDKDRSGLALGEGAAFLVLEKMTNARRRRARVYGVVKGYASNADANHMTGPDREGKGLANAITRALKEAGLARVDYISAHGTGTPYNDLMETLAIKRAFGRSDIPVSSIKSMIGHSFGAAGAIEAVTCVKAMDASFVPPTVNLEKDDPKCDLDYVKDNARQVAVESAVSLSAGFGGQNAALVFAKSQ
jgi:3-oxoacyl-(acyl-carrier-protein) synthase